MTAEDVKLPLKDRGPDFSDPSPPKPGKGKEGVDAGPPLEEMFRKLEVKIENLPVSDDYVALVPAPHSKLCQDLHPTGPMSITYGLQREGPGAARTRLLLEPKGMKIRFDPFPYTVEGITGTIEQKSDGLSQAITHVDLTTNKAGWPLRFKGDFRGKEPNHQGDLDIWGDNVPLDDKLLNALKDGEAKKSWDLAMSFHAKGLGNFHVHSHHNPGEKPWATTYHITFHHAGMCYKPFPLELTDVTGVLDIHPDESFDFHDFFGRHGDATFATRGRSVLREGIKYVQVAIAGRGVALDKALYDALLDPELKSNWRKFNPDSNGRIDFDGTVTIPPVPPNEEKVKPEIDLTVQARGCKIKPDFFRYSLDEVYGKVHYVRNTVELEDLRARHGDTLVRVDHGVVQFLPGGGFVADMTYLHATPLVSDGDFLKAVPEPLRKGLTALDVQGPTELHTRLYIIDKLPNVNPPRIYWDGSLVLRGVALQTGVKLQHVYGLVAARGWYNGTHLEGVVGNLDLGQVVLYNQPLHNLHGELLVSVEEPDVLKFPGLMMEYCGGQIYGPVRVEFGPKTSFEMNLTASQVQLEELGRHNFKPTTEMSGLAGCGSISPATPRTSAACAAVGCWRFPAAKYPTCPCCWICSSSWTAFPIGRPSRKFTRGLPSRGCGPTFSSWTCTATPSACAARATSTWTAAIWPSISTWIGPAWGNCCRRAFAPFRGRSATNS